MSLKISTGLRNAMLDTGSFKSVMDGCTLKIYSGVEPATADTELSGNTLLSEIFLNNDGATGLTFQSPAVDGVISKATIESWEGTNAAAGTASFYRLELSGDTQGLSTTEKRVQGSAGITGAQLNLGSLSLASSASQKIDYYSLALPTL